MIEIYREDIQMIQRRIMADFKEFSVASHDEELGVFFVMLPNVELAESSELLHWIKKQNFRGIFTDIVVIGMRLRLIVPEEIHPFSLFFIASDGEVCYRGQEITLPIPNEDIMVGDHSSVVIEPVKNFSFESIYPLAA